MDIFESLENLEVSEACFDEIMGIVEALIDEKMTDPEEYKAIANKVIPQRKAKFEKAFQEFKKVHDKIDPERIVNYKLTPVEKYRTNKTATKFERANDRLRHAQEVAGKIKKTPHGIEIEK